MSYWSIHRQVLATTDHEHLVPWEGGGWPGVITLTIRGSHLPDGLQFPTKTAATQLRPLTLLGRSVGARF